MIFSSSLPLKMKSLENVRINEYLSEFVGYTPNLSNVNFLVSTGDTKQRNRFASTVDLNIALFLISQNGPSNIAKGKCYAVDSRKLGKITFT